MSQLHKAIGKRIRDLRAARNLSQEAFADICDIHRSHMGEIERAEIDASISTIQKVARGFGMTISVFLKGVA